MYYKKMFLKEYKNICENDVFFSKVLYLMNSLATDSVLEDLTIAMYMVLEKDI